MSLSASAVRLSRVNITALPSLRAALSSEFSAASEEFSFTNNLVSSDLESAATMSSGSFTLIPNTVSCSLSPVANLGAAFSSNATKYLSKWLFGSKITGQLDEEPCLQQARAAIHLSIVIWSGKTLCCCQSDLSSLVERMLLTEKSFCILTLGCWLDNPRGYPWDACIPPPWWPGILKLPRLTPPEQ